MDVPIEARHESVTHVEVGVTLVTGRIEGILETEDALADS
jgi:hypothetical protein